MLTILRFAADSLALEKTRKVLLDTVGKSDIEKGIISSIDSMTSVPADQLVPALLDKGITFGLKVVAAILIYIAGGWLIRLVKKFLRGFFKRKQTEPAIVSFTTSLVTALLWVLVIVITVGTLGIETTSLAALLAAGGMAIGMALSGTVQNFAGGVMILIFKPFKVGDYIEAQGFAGTVSEVNITATKLVTLDNRVVILPNGPLQSGSVNNYSKLPYRRVDLTIGVEYGSDANAVKEAILGIAKADDRILTKEQGAPADPFIALSNLGASSVDFTVRLWTRSENYWGVYFDTNESIYRTLPANGIQFPFTQIQVHMDKQ